MSKSILSETNIRKTIKDALSEEQAYMSKKVVIESLNIDLKNIESKLDSIKGLKDTVDIENMISSDQKIQKLAAQLGKLNWMERNTSGDVTSFQSILLSKVTNPIINFAMNTKFVQDLFDNLSNKRDEWIQKTAASISGGSEASDDEIDIATRIFDTSLESTIRKFEKETESKFSKLRRKIKV